MTGGKTFFYLHEFCFLHFYAKLKSQELSLIMCVCVCVCVCIFRPEGELSFGIHSWIGPFDPDWECWNKNKKIETKKTYLKSHWSLGKVTLSVAARDIEGTRMPPFEGGPKMVAASFSAPDVGRLLAKQLFLDKPGSPLRWTFPPGIEMIINAMVLWLYLMVIIAVFKHFHR